MITAYNCGMSSCLHSWNFILLASDETRLFGCCLSSLIIHNSYRLRLLSMTQNIQAIFILRNIEKPETATLISLREKRIWKLKTIRCAIAISLVFSQRRSPDNNYKYFLALLVNYSHNYEKTFSIWLIIHEYCFFLKHLKTQGRI